jgi:Fur family ferric uptake transcriptional regulator
MAMEKFQRKTRQRQAILEELQKLTSHPTAAELYEIVRKRLPKISLGTVYRNLELLARDDIIQKLPLGGSEARFDGNPARHHHVRCIHCGRVDDLHGLPINPVGSKLKESNGWKILGYRLDFIGICPGCKGTHKEDV